MKGESHNERELFMKALNECIREKRSVAGRGSVVNVASWEIAPKMGVYRREAEAIAVGLVREGVIVDNGLHFYRTMSDHLMAAVYERDARERRRRADEHMRRIRERYARYGESFREHEIKEE